MMLSYCTIKYLEVYHYRLYYCARLDALTLLSIILFFKTNEAVTAKPAGLRGLISRHVLARTQQQVILSTFVRRGSK